MLSPTRFGGEAVHVETQNVIMEKIKHNNRSVSKSVAWCQKDVHGKACLATGYTARAWGTVARADSQTTHSKVARADSLTAHSKVARPDSLTAHISLEPN
jgi:hypothetical protein